MKLREKISLKIVDYIKKNNVEITEEKLEIIKYGFDCIFINLNKFVLIFLISFILGLEFYTLIFFIGYGFIRSFASGIHFDSSLKCLISTFITVFTTLFISIHFNIPTYLKMLLFVFSFICILLYAPADTEYHPIVNPKKRKKLKILSLVSALVILLLSISIFLLNVIGNILILSLTFETITILPITYKIFNRRYNNYENYQENLSNLS